MSVAAIALGGNIGDVANSFRRAIFHLMEQKLSVVRTSRVYKTAPVGGDSANAYMNAAILVTTEFLPERVLDILQSVELQLGRTRNNEWGPRPIDLDLIWFDEMVLESERLTLPHPAAWYRRFVLEPLGDICPEWRHPVRKIAVLRLLARYSRKPVQIGLAGSLLASEEVMNLWRSGELDRFSQSVSLRPCQPGTEDQFAVIAWKPLAFEQDQVVHFGSHSTPIAPIHSSTGGNSAIHNEPVCNQIHRDGATQPVVARPRRPAGCNSAASFQLLPVVSRLDVQTIAPNQNDWLKVLLQSVCDIPVPTGEVI